jgi:hypothetical protein
MRVLPRPQHATVVAYLALFVALGGVSYAAIKLPANSVGSKQIKKSAVTKSKLKKGAVTSSKIKANAVTSRLVKDGSLQTADFAQLPAGAQGPPGVPGEPGTAGATGPPGPTFGDVGLTTGCCASPTPTAAASVTASRTVTLPAAARLYVFGSVRAVIENCSSSCTMQWGLRVDGVAVSGSGRKLATLGIPPTPTPYIADTLTPWGITETLGAGAHTIQLVKEPLVGPMAGSAFGDQDIGAIALGS